MSAITYHCGRCCSALQTDQRGNHWCPACKVYRPPFRPKMETSTAPPLTGPIDENLSTRGK